MFRYSRPLSSYYRFFTPINRRCSETVHKPVRVKADRILQEQKQKIVNKKLLHEQIAQEHGKKLARVENVDAKGSTRRWFKQVTVDEFESKVCKGKTYRVLLDGRAILTPGNNVLWTPSEILSYAVASEWEMQEKTITPHMMPLMSVCCTTLDHVPTKRDHAMSTMLGFILTDTLCYRAKKSMRRLYDAQVEYHQPVVEWFQEKFNCPVNIVPEGKFEDAKQADILFQKTRVYLSNLSDWEIASLYQLIENLKSFILGVALFEGRIDVDWAIKASRAEEHYQISQFGMVEAEHDVTETDISTKVGAAVFVGSLVKGLEI